MFWILLSTLNRQVYTYKIALQHKKIRSPLLGHRLTATSTPVDTLLQSGLLALREEPYTFSSLRRRVSAAVWSEPPSSLLVAGLFINSPCGTGVTAISALLTHRNVYLLNKQSLPTYGVHCTPPELLCRRAFISLYPLRGPASLRKCVLHRLLEGLTSTQGARPQP